MKTVRRFMVGLCLMLLGLISGFVTYFGLIMLGSEVIPNILDGLPIVKTPVYWVLRTLVTLLVVVGGIWILMRNSRKVNAQIKECVDNDPKTFLPNKELVLAFHLYGELAGIIIFGIGQLALCIMWLSIGTTSIGGG